MPTNHNVHIAPRPWSGLDGSDASTTKEEDDNDINGVDHAADAAVRVNIVRCQSCGARGNIPHSKEVCPATDRDCYCCGIKDHGFAGITSWQEKQKTDIDGVEFATNTAHDFKPDATPHTNRGTLVVNLKRLWN